MTNIIGKSLKKEWICYKCRKKVTFIYIAKLKAQCPHCKFIWQMYSIKKHSVKIQNYITSLLETGDPVNTKEFREIYVKLSSGKHPANNANFAINEFSNLLKFQ